MHRDELIFALWALMSVPVIVVLLLGLRRAAAALTRRRHKTKIV